MMNAVDSQRRPDRRLNSVLVHYIAINRPPLDQQAQEAYISNSDLMRALLSPACGVVQELFAETVIQCSCIGALNLARIQPAHWACSSSSSSNSLQQHPGRLQQQRGKSTVRMVLLKVGTTDNSLSPGSFCAQPN